MSVSRSPDLSARHAAGCLFGIVLVAGLLRFFRLGVEPLWHDEVFELIQVQDFWATLLTGANVSSHPPLYVVLMKIPSTLGLHDTEWGVRVLAAVLGIATVPAVYLCAAHLITRRIGVAAAAVVALSTFHIVHSQDAKSYILLPLTGTLLVYAAVRAWDEGGRWWPAYTLLAALAFYSQAFAVPLLLLLNGWFLVEAWRKKRPIRAWFLWNVGAFLLALPWILIMLSKAGDIMIAAEDWWIPRPRLVDLVFAIKTMAFGYSDDSPAFRLVLLGSLALAAFGAWSLRRSHPRETLLLVLWWLVPVAMLFLVSQVANSIFLYRALLPFAIPFYALVGAGILAIPRLPWRMGAATLLFAATLPSLSEHYFQTYTSSLHPHRPGIHLPADYDLAAKTILSEWQEGDRILLVSGAAMLPLYHYGLNTEPYRMRTVSASPFHVEYLRRSQPRTVFDPFFDDYFPILVTDAIGDARRIWFVFNDWEQEFLQHNGRDTWRWLDARYPETARHAWRGIDLRLYELADAPVVVQRDADDGVQAEVSLRDPDGALRVHTHTVPDWSPRGTPLHERRGRAVLHWEGSDAFVLRNTSGTPLSLEVHVVRSAAVVPLLAWLDDEVADGWFINDRQNPDPPPSRHEWSVLTIAREPGESAALRGVIPHTVGSIDASGGAALFWSGPGRGNETARTNLSVTLGAHRLVPQWDEEAPRWGWAPLVWEVPGADASLAGGADAAVTIEASRDDGPSFADVALLAFGDARATVHMESLGVVTLAGHEERFIAMPEGAWPRTDILAFEREEAEAGRVYHIFRHAP